MECRWKVHRHLQYRRLHLLSLSVVPESLFFASWCCILFAIFCFAFAQIQYLSTWSSKTIMNDAYDLLLWSRSSYFSYFAVCLLSSATISFIMTWESTLIKRSYCGMFTFGCDKGIIFVSLFNGFFGASNVPHVPCLSSV